jgi:hypothetical protein
VPAKPFCQAGLDQARVLVIGHDPRLQRTDTQADCALFGDDYSRPEPACRSEHRKYGLAKAAFSCVAFLTGGRYPPEQIALTNLFNGALQRPPTRRRVLISESAARAGLSQVQGLLAFVQVELILPMSQQVNYWLQKLGFYGPVPEFLSASEPARAGVMHDPPFYRPRRDRAFRLIYGNLYSGAHCTVVPILHVKQWPLRGRFRMAYADAYDRCRRELTG